uniref:Protein CIP2A n=1 Tax=Panagrolaimus sp. ES5 TaxID=591445 RepID=A0AC34FRY5_9BILA
MNDIDILIQNVNSAILNYCTNPSNTKLALALEDQLTILVRESALIDNSGRLKPQASHVEQLLYQTYELLSASSTSTLIRSKLLLYLYNITQYNVKIRRYLSGELQIAGIVYQNLRIALQEHLGPQNLIDNLRLLQVLTYEKSLVLADWTTDLLHYLLNEVTRTNDQELLPYCVAILCNLVCRSKAVCSKIMKDSKVHKTLCKKLVEFLQNSSRTVVICSLTMVGYLHEQTRDIVFSPPHLQETFLCIFNIMKSRENIMTRHTSLGPSLANTAKDLTSYSFFSQCVRDLACHLVLLDARTEECIKIYEFFIAICQLQQLRSQICSAILLTQPSENRLTTPILGMLSTASWSFDDAIDPEVPILACELLTYVLKEAVDSNQPIQHFIPLDSLVDLIRTNVKTTIETKSEIVSYQCRRITCGLRLADAISGDEEARKELLEAVTAQLCAHVNESQLISNPVSLYLSKPPAQRLPTDLPEWSTYGVTIPLELLKLLASLKDYNKAHKELYWRSLKDERLIPFLAYSISYGNGSTVSDALTLFTHCTQVQDYRIKLLSDLIASCGKSKISKDRKSPTENGTNKRKSVSLDTSAEFFKDNILLLSNGSPANSQKDLDELLAKMKSNMDIRDVRFSQLVQVFESKIGMLQEREAYLEREITDLRKLNAKSRSQRNGDSAETGAFRGIIAEMERKMDEAETEKLALQSEKEMLAQELAKLKLNQDNMKALLDSSKAAMELLQHEKTVLMAENDREREVHVALRGKFNEMRNNFDLATKTAFKKEQEIVDLKNELVDSRDEIRILKENLRQEQATSNKLREENAELQRLKQQLAKMLS